LQTISWPAVPARSGGIGGLGARPAIPAGTVNIYDSEADALKIAQGLGVERLQADKASTTTFIQAVESRSEMRKNVENLVRLPPRTTLLEYVRRSLSWINRAIKVQIEANEKTRVTNAEGATDEYVTQEQYKQATNTPGTPEYYYQRLIPIFGKYKEAARPGVQAIVTELLSMDPVKLKQIKTALKAIAKQRLEQDIHMLQQGL
jgi:hypothetical protein